MINVGRARNQADEIDDYASALRELKNRLNNFKGNINADWQATEMVYVNQAIEKMNNEISKLTSKLNSLADDIVSVAREIRREEEERAAR